MNALWSLKKAKEKLSLYNAEKHVIKPKPERCNQRLFTLSKQEKGEERHKKGGKKSKPILFSFFTYFVSIFWTLLTGSDPLLHIIALWMSVRKHSNERPVRVRHPDNVSTRVALRIHQGLTKHRREKEKGIFLSLVFPLLRFTARLTDRDLRCKCDKTFRGKYLCKWISKIRTGTFFTLFSHFCFFPLKVPSYTGVLFCFF